MKKRFLAMALLVALVVCMALSASAVEPVITAVNNDPLPLKSSTIATKRNGEWYVPYTVFASGSTSEGQLGLFISNNASQNNLLVYNVDDQKLLFDLNDNTVTDESGNYYYQPAYYINNTIYLPVRTVCSKFGLKYSYIVGNGYSILRIVSTSKLSDNLFGSAMVDLATKMADTYRNSLNPGTPVNPPPAEGEDTPPVIPPGEAENVPTPSLVQFTFDGALNENTQRMAEVLRAYGIRGTFFADGGSIVANDDLLRQLIADGHAVGISVENGAFDSGEQLLAQLNQANEDLFYVTGCTTRLVRIAGDDGTALTLEMLEALHGSGYRLWGSTLDCGLSSSSRIVAAAVKRLRETNGQVVLRMPYTEAAADSLSSVLEEIRARRIPTAILFENDMPRNIYGYTS